MSSFPKNADRSAVSWVAWCYSSVCNGPLVAVCGVLLIVVVGCGGSADSDNVLDKRKASGNAAAAGSTNLALAGNGGMSGSGASAEGGSSGTAGTSTRPGWDSAGAAGSNGCFGPCTDGRVCSKVVDSYSCTPRSCGSEQLAKLDLPDQDGGQIALGNGYAYVATKTGVEVADIHDPRNPVLVGELAGTFTGIAWEPNRLYLADTASGLVVADVSDPKQPKRMTTLPVPGGASCVRADGAIAYLCAGDGTAQPSYLQVVDLAQPDQPVLRGQLAMPKGVTSIDSAGPIAYLVDASGQFVVVDATNLDQPSTLASLKAGARKVKLIGSRAFLGGTNVVDVYDVSTPAAPTLFSEIPVLSGSSVFDVDGNLIALVALGGPPSGLVAIDVSDLAQPEVSRMLGDGNYLWTSASVALNNGFAYVAAPGKLVTYDVITPVNQRIVSTYEISGGAISAMQLEGTHAYILSGSRMSTGQLLVVDNSDPLQPSQIGSFSIDAWGLGVRNQRGYLLHWGNTVDFELLELDLHDSQNLAVTGSVMLDGALSGRLNGQMAVTFAGDYAYLLGEAAITVVHVGQTTETKQPKKPEFVRTLDLAGAQPNQIRLTTTHAIVTASVSSAGSATGSGELLVFDLSDPANPSLVGTLATSASLTGIDLAEPYAYVGATGQGMMVVDLEFPSDPRLVATVDNLPGGEDEVVILGNRVYAGRAAVDIANPEHPVFLYQADIPGMFRRAVSDGKLLTVSDDHVSRHTSLLSTLNYIDPTRCVP